VSQKLLLATRHQGKIVEFRRILDALAPGAIELVGLDQFPDLHDVDETGSTFQENALLKAREMSEATGLPAIADDSGLCVDALNGDPGIFRGDWGGLTVFTKLI
jgi:XTP/dITP diphosphohydrolase